MRPTVTLSEIESAIRGAWSAETAHAPARWSATIPAAGQCWTSAFVVRALLGGEIGLAEIGGTDPLQRHAWNRVPSGIANDITREQFSDAPALTPCDVPEELLMHVSGAQVQLLLERVAAALGILAPTSGGSVA